MCVYGVCVREFVCACMVCVCVVCGVCVCACIVFVRDCESDKMRQKESKECNNVFSVE